MSASSRRASVMSRTCSSLRTLVAPFTRRAAAAAARFWWKLPTAPPEGDRTSGGFDSYRAAVRHPGIEEQLLPDLSDELAVDLHLGLLSWWRCGCGVASPGS